MDTHSLSLSLSLSNMYTHTWNMSSANVAGGREGNSEPCATELQSWSSVSTKSSLVPAYAHATQNIINMGAMV